MPIAPLKPVLPCVYALDKSSFSSESFSSSLSLSNYTGLDPEKFEDYFCLYDENSSCFYIRYSLSYCRCYCWRAFASAWILRSSAIFRSSSCYSGVNIGYCCCWVAE